MSSYKPWANFEREIRKDLVPLGFDAKRNWSNQFLNKDGADIVATDGENQLVVQCKYGAKPNIMQALKQAESAVTNKKAIPLALVRFKGTKNTIVALSWHDFKKIVKGEW
jgi:Holliday junction resolvase